MRQGLLVVAAVLLAGCTAPTQAPPDADDGDVDEETSPTTTVQSKPSDIAKKYILAFHACDTGQHNCRQIQGHQVYLAQSDDERSWSVVPGWEPKPGSVPDAVRRGDVLYLYTPGMLHRHRFSTGEWEGPIPVDMRNGDGTRADFVDPSVRVDPDGRIVLFYLPAQMGSEPASCPGGGTCTKYIRSATEIEGSDGTSFVVDPGDRIAITISFGVASDPDIFPHPNGWVLYISRGPGTQVAFSDELRGSYSNAPGLPDGMLTSNQGGIPSGHWDDATGRYWTYVHKEHDGVERIRLAVHATLDAPLQDDDFQDVLTGTTIPGGGAAWSVASPGFTRNDPAGG